MADVLFLARARSFFMPTPSNADGGPPSYALPSLQTTIRWTRTTATRRRGDTEEPDHGMPRLQRLVVRKKHLVNVSVFSSCAVFLADKP